MDFNFGLRLQYFDYVCLKKGFLLKNQLHEMIGVESVTVDLKEFKDKNQTIRQI